MAPLHATKFFRCGLAMLSMVGFSIRSLALESERAVPEDKPKPHQTVSHGQPPAAPKVFNPDPGRPPFRPHLFEPEEIQLQLRKRISRGTPAKPPPVFNPDPGAMQKTNVVEEPFFKHNFGLQMETFGEEPVEKGFELPRKNLRQNEIVEATPKKKRSRYGFEPLPKNLKLPREDTRINQRIPKKWENLEYPLAHHGLGYPANSEPVTNRWLIGFTPWRRYVTADAPLGYSANAETPYLNAEPEIWHPYRQSYLKGDLPVIGQDIFLNLTASTETVFEARRLPTPSSVSSSQPNSSEFFGQSEQLLFQNYFSFTADLFKGETVFQPAHWTVHLEPVANVNYVDTHETTVINPNPAHGTTRTDGFVSLQQAFGEYHLTDLSDNYDFCAIRGGNQPFNSDFRGFIFNEVNSAVRFFGNYANNLCQYNVVVFDMREKDTNSELNKFDERNQRIFILNLYKQDFLTHGYTAQWSFHANFDEGTTHYDSNGNITRPAPIGTVIPHDLQAYYLGWAGDGHIGRWNVNHAFYQVLGRDGFNGIAGQPTDINAQMGALEVSYDRDWIRYKGSFFYASGDGKAEDGHATGFDSIVDNPTFVGGPFSWYVRQGFNLAGSSVALKQRNSLVPDLRTSKTEGQANFVNPGIFIYGLGLEIDVTPKLRSFVNANYIRFAETDSLKTVLLTDKVDNELGYDLSLGFQYRPLLTDNIIISAGFGVLIPGRGYRDIYKASTDPVPGLNSASPGRVDDFLYSGLIAITLTY